MGPYTEEQLLKKVKELSQRFRGYGEKEELKSEAILAYYEGVAAGDTDESSLITKMRKAMNAYANFGTKPTKIPSRGENYRLTKELPPQEFDKLSPREKDVYKALRGNTKEISDMADYLQQDQMSPEELYHWKSCLEKFLTGKERQVLHMSVIGGMSNREIGDHLGVTHQRVSQIIDEAIKILREKV